MSLEGRTYVGRCPVSRHSMQSYIPTYYRLGKRELLIALGSHRGGGWGGGGLNSCIRGTPPLGMTHENYVLMSFIVFHQSSP